MNASRKFAKASSKKFLCVLSAGLLTLATGTDRMFAVSGGSHAPESVQQTISRVEGSVKDDTGEPLIGVSVVLKGTSTGTVTDIDGRYSINIKGDNPVLEFSYVGYKPQSIPATKSVINVVLESNAIQMGDVVVVGYGVQKKENLTGAVASVDLNKTLESRPVTDVGRALQGAIPGLTVSTKSGEIGSAPTIKIRGGVGSPNGSSNPLILVDNVEITDISLVNPDDIESMSVLKDAASSSIYGARAAFGVILITTKAKKQLDRLTVNYSNNFAWRTPTKRPEQLPGWQQAEINLLGVQSAPSPANSYNVVGNMLVDQTTVDKMKEWADKFGDGKGLGREMEYGRDFEYDGKSVRFYRTWDWYDMYIKDWMPQQTHNLSVSGGNGKTSYGATLGYVHQEGLTKVNSDEYDRYNASLTLNTEISKYLTARANAMYTRTDFEKPFVYGSDLYDHMYYLYRWQPMYPYGTYNGKPFRSALTELEQAQMTRREKDYLRLNAGLTFKPFEGLSIDYDFVYSSTEARYKKFGGKVYAYDIFTAHKTLDAMEASYGNYISSSYDYAYEERGRTQMFTNNLVATYSKKINDHDFKVMLGSNIESSEYRYISAQRKGLYNVNQPELNLAYGDQTVSSEHTHWAVAGFFGRFNYSFKDRYLFEVNGRYDGSSKFPTGDRFGFFPSVSVGYRITEEEFMKFAYPTLTSLKLRASYGSIGNQDVGLNAFRSVLDPSPNYNWIIDGERTPAMSAPSVVYPSLTWETVKTIDVGFDARLFDDKVGITFDWYNRTTSDILAASILPQTLGATSPKRNFGELENPGWELAVDFRHTFNNGLTITAGAQISDYKTKVKKWSNNTAMPSYGGNGEGWLATSAYKEGMTLGDIWGLQVDRLLQESDFDANGNLLEGIPNQKEVFPSGYKFAPGDVLYKDLDGDGKISKGVSTDETKDLSIIGNSLARYEYGFNIGAEYKGFDFNMFFQGVGKRNIWAAGNQVLPGYTAGEPYYKGAEDYWRPDNTGAFYPRPMNYSQVQSGNYQVNDRYLLNMAYLRCKTLTLGYTLPRDLVRKAFISNLRVYFTAENLFTFDSVKPDIDPEIDIRYVGSSADARNFGRSYPQQKTLSFGMQLTF